MILFISIILFLSYSCETKNPNEKIVRNFIEYLNSGDEKKANLLLSNDFNKESILLKKIEIDNDEKIKKNDIEKECLIIDNLEVIDKNTIKTTEHLENIYSKVMGLEMPKYEVKYFVANQKIISITLNLEKAREDSTLTRQIEYQNLITSFEWWFSDNYPKFNNTDFLIENGLEKYIEEYSKLDSTVLKKYKVNLYN
jgi:hypothetical protein